MNNTTQKLVAMLVMLATVGSFCGPSANAQTPLSEEPRPLAQQPASAPRSIVTLQPETCRPVYTQGFANAVGTIISERICFEPAEVWQCPAGLSADARARRDSGTYAAVIVTGAVASVASHCLFDSFTVACPGGDRVICERVSFTLLNCSMSAAPMALATPVVVAAPNITVVRSVVESDGQQGSPTLSFNPIVPSFTG